MQLRKTLADLSAMLKKQSGKTITFTQTAPNTLRTRYLIEMTLVLNDHSDDTLQFAYQLGWGASLLAKSTAGLFGHIRTQKLSVNAQAQTLSIHLAAFAEFRPVLQTHKIAAAKIENSVLVVDLLKK